MEYRPLEQHAKPCNDYSGEISYNKTVKRMVGVNGDEVILDIFKNVKRPVLNFLIEPMLPNRRIAAFAYVDSETMVYVHFKTGRIC